MCWAQDTGLDATDIAQIVAAVATVIAVGLAAWSASLSRAAVERANMAFVWPAFTVGHEDSWDDPKGPYGVRVRLHADGLGVALDVRWSLYFGGRGHLSNEVLPVRTPQRRSPAGSTTAS